MRRVFGSSENSAGFHNPQKAAHIRSDAIDRARQAQIEAIEVMPKK